MVIYRLGAISMTVSPVVLVAAPDVFSLVTTIATPWNVADCNNLFHAPLKHS